MSKVWLITGSSRGLGHSLAEAVLAHGDQLVATARKLEQLQDLVEKYGEQVRAVALDVTNTEQAHAAIAGAVKAFGRLDVVVNNAGYANVTTIEDASDEEWHAQMEANLWGVINVTRAALPVLRKQRSGHFLQVSSIGGRTTSAGLGPYQTAKWAVEGFSEVLSREVKHLGIKVTLIEPGSFRTDWGGASMTFIEANEDYERVLEPMIAYRKDISGKEPGDPNKAAQALITLVNETNPPLRLPLGSDAFKIARLVDQAKLAETERWEHLITSTDYDDIEHEPLAHGMGLPQSSQETTR
ncbi:short-chain dehydrogenase/reductase [Dictyobacter alpinus]|uniref:Short-chain dehydrogenase/reductase n=1 Tax=Dictyobacter alpinus TaxID=2014873 RepID=A0A402BJ44_9CHLR|nr:oxidoreductase [Dictyobacter alpinus]GCE31360.1 short-chain dehydrogenase/reductase [Dictyobacter alpinus]